VIVTLYGKRGNVGTDQIEGELRRDCNRYQVIEEFEWARDEECNTLAPHIDPKTQKAFIQKMPTIHLHGDKETIAKWLLEAFENPIMKWHYVGQDGDFWITGFEECQKFVRGAKWPCPV